MIRNFGMYSKNHSRLHATRLFKPTRIIYFLRRVMFDIAERRKHVRGLNRSNKHHIGLMRTFEYHTHLTQTARDHVPNKDNRVFLKKTTPYTFIVTRACSTTEKINRKLLFTLSF